MAQETKSLGDLEQIKGAAAPAAAPEHVQKLDSLGRAYATGKRKNAVARVWLKPGRGAIIINDKDYTKYFARPVLQMLLQQPLSAVSRNTQYDIMATVVGGGLVRSGRCRASRHLQGADLLRAGPAQRPQEGRLPHARQPRRRAQEVRPHESPPQLPVLQALISAWNCTGSLRRAALGAARRFLGPGRLAQASRECHIRPRVGHTTLRRSPAAFRQDG